jgi:hypothetical protein
MNLPAGRQARSEPHPLDLLAELVAGTSPAAEAARVKAHVDGCRACTAELAAWRAAAGSLRERAVLAIPSPDLPDRIARRIAAASAVEAGLGSRARRRATWLVSLVLAQVPVVRRDIWPASSVVIAIGAGISLVPGAGGTGGALALFAPLAAAIGIAMIYGQENDPSLELALATPVSPRLVVIARLVLVFAFDLALAVAASLALAAVDGPAIAAPLIGLWLGPMLLLGCLSLALSLIVGTPVAIVVAGAIWAIRALEVTDSRLIRDFAGLSQAIDAVWQTSVLTLVSAAAILAIAVAVAPRREGLPASPAV